MVVEGIDFVRLREDILNFQSIRGSLQRSYPKDIKDRVRGLHNQGSDLGALSQQLKISFDSLQRWVNKRPKAKSFFKEVRLKPPADFVDKSRKLVVSFERGRFSLEVGAEGMDLLRELMGVV